MTETVK